MTTQPSTYTSRNLHVAAPMRITGFWLGDNGMDFTDEPVLHGMRFTVDPPADCQPLIHYRVDIDVETRTATITAAGAS